MPKLSQHDEDEEMSEAWDDVIREVVGISMTVGKLFPSMPYLENEKQIYAAMIEAAKRTAAEITGFDTYEAAESEAFPQKK